MNSDCGSYAVSGRVKWFDQVRGFGFVVSDEGGSDILLHANVLRNYGQSSVVQGAEIILMAKKTERGVQATEVMEIITSETSEDPVLDDLLDSGIDYMSLPLEPARVKWFDKTKGFGFANVFGRSADVFVHVEVLRRGGFSDLQSGEAVGLRIIESDRGQLAADVVAWDMEARERENFDD